MGGDHEGVEGGAPLSALLAPVQISRAVAARLEARMKQQVRLAVDAQAAQQRSLALGDRLAAPWRLVGAEGSLRAYKMRGRDPAAGGLRWPSTARAAADELAISEETGSRSRSQSQSLSRARGQSAADALDMQSFRVFGRVQGHFRDIVAAHYAANSADLVQQQRLLSPLTADAAVLRSIRATRDSYLGVKWLSEAAPATRLLGGGRGARRDCCVLEMVGFTADAHGREVGFVAVASIDAPECPPFPDFLRVARVRVQRTMLVRATDASLATSELFLMGESDDARAGAASALAGRARLRVLLAVLRDVSLVIDSQNLVKQTLIAPQAWLPDHSRAACSVCSRAFHFLRRRRHHCRLCGEIVCRTCYVMRTVPRADFAPVVSTAPPPATRLQRAATDRRLELEDDGAVGATKFCVRCVMGLRAIDHRLEAFSQHISKLMSVSDDSFALRDAAEASGVSTTSSDASLPALALDASVTYFKRGSNETREINLDELFEDHVRLAHVGGGGKRGRVGTAISARETAAEPSIVGHSSSRGKLVRLSTLSRSSSSSRLLAELYARQSVTVV